MASVTQLFSAKAVLLDLDVPDRPALFSAVGQLWHEIHGLSVADVANNLTAREELGSTGLGEGVAIPHARMDGLTEPVAAFVRLKAPIPFDSPDGKPVACCFVLLVPEKVVEQHMQILAGVAKMFSDAQTRGRLEVSTSQDEVRQLFFAWTAPTIGAI